MSNNNNKESKASANPNPESAYKTYSQMDETERQEFQRQTFATVNKMAMQDMSRISRTTSFLARFKIEEISRWLQNPAQFEKQIRQLSSYLYNISPHYRRLILYISLMPTYAYVLDPLDLPENLNVDRFKKQYKKTLQDIEKMNLKHELIKVAKIAFKEDYYFGYVNECKDSFFLQKLDADHCRISSIEDGVFNFAFDFSIFDYDTDLLNSYPIEFKRKYGLYRNSNDNDMKWQELDSDKTLCVKINEELNYGLPLFSTMFESIFDLDEYKRIKKSRSKADNFMTLTHKIPMDEKNPDVNKFLIDLDLAATFHSMAESILPENIGLISSPMKIEAIKMDQSKTNVDLIANANRDVFNDSGVSQHLFNSDKTTSTGLSSSILNDSSLTFSFLRQVERWVNRRIKRMSGQYKFKFKFLDITVFNQDSMFDMYLKGAQSGLPVITEAAASIGLSPLDLMNKATLEGDILGLHDILKPLQTSHTQSSKDEAGRNKLKDDEISDSGQVNRDANTDENRE